MTKAIILAAGRGSRLLPLTSDKPKTMLEIDKKPILEYILERVAKIGVSEIVIVVGFCKEKIIDYVGEEYKGIKVSYVDNPLFDKTNSTYSLWLAKELVGSDFLTINADTIFSSNILKYMMETDKEIALSIDDVLPLPDDAMKVIIKEGKIVDVSKKIPDELNNGDAIGIYRFQGNGVVVLFEELDRLVEENNLGELFTFAVQNILNENNVYPVSTKGLAWIEIDTVNDLEEGKEIVLKMLEEEK